jgi:hypothetical protein
MEPGYVNEPSAGGWQFRIAADGSLGERETVTRASEGTFGRHCL